METLQSVHNLHYKNTSVSSYYQYRQPDLSTNRSLDVADRQPYHAVSHRKLEGSPHRGFNAHQHLHRWVRLHVHLHKLRCYGIAHRRTHRFSHWSSHGGHRPPYHAISYREPRGWPMKEQGIILKHPHVRATDYRATLQPSIVDALPTSSIRYA